MTEIAIRTNGLADKAAYAKQLAESGLLPMQYRKQPANVLWAVEFGEMLGLSPMAAINGVHVIEGKPTASAALIGALVRRAGHKLRVSGDDKKAVAEIVRSDDPGFTFRSEWTIERARAANLTGKKVWQQYPAAMLKARAITECARDACEEALNGVHYTPEEMGASVDETGGLVHVEASREDQVPPSEWDAEIADRAGDRERLLELHAQARSLGADQAVLNRIVAAGKAAAAEIVEAEIVDTEPAATDKQLTAIAAALGEHGVKDRGQRLAVVSLLVGDRVESTKQLTKSEAGHVLDAIAKHTAEGRIAETIQAAIAAWGTLSEEIA